RREELLLGVQDHPHAVGHCQRCQTLVEPRLSRQWFLRVAPLVTPAVEAVEQGRIRFYPDSWKKTYFEWMRNIHDWCISRQLWWGHRIPAWYCAGEEHVVVAERAPERCPECGDRALRQDPDVLDTWFSSSLWPFSTLGWPRPTRDLKRYYPTSTLVTGYDIIFFWVARMIMMGLKLRGDVPFREVYFNGLVRDERGEKMSKTRGNVIDPLEVIESHGADAVRFTLAVLAVPGTEIPLSPGRMDGYRAFVNKLWNAARFVLMNLDAGPKPALPGLRRRQLEDRWILSRVNRVTREVDEALTAYRFDEAANRLYHLTWHEFCDWYVEFSKLPLSRGGGDGRRAAAILLEVLDRILRLLHPFMPFVTEELWQKLPGRRGTIGARPFPKFRPAEVDEAAEMSVGFLVDLITRVRNVRAEARVEPARPIRLVAKVGDPGRRRLLEEKEPLVRRLTRAERIDLVDEFPPGLLGARGVLGEAEFAIPLAGILDRDGERQRLEREKHRVDQELEATGRKLNNAAFLQNAPARIVEKVQDEHRRLLEKRARLERSLEDLRT
ncbi:MAG: class I tRNA ligase family protein, partial [Acidobacteria bacterium]|nr:class I tRNA ligase family protein [Acidobacteriota bacterium]